MSHCGGDCMKCTKTPYVAFYNPRTGQEEKMCYDCDNPLKLPALISEEQCYRPSKDAPKERPRIRIESLNENISTDDVIPWVDQQEGE